MQLKRCFLSIHQGMLSPPLNAERCNESAMRVYWDELKKAIAQHPEYTAGALALEIAPKTGTLHLQGYLEHSRKRVSTIASDLLCDLTNGIMVVKDAQGSWNYCAGLAEYAEKKAVSRLVWGEPKLHGSAEKNDLKTLIQQVIDGAALNDIMKSSPYSWAVHRDRVIKFHDDWYYGIPEREVLPRRGDIFAGKD